MLFSSKEKYTKLIKQTAVQLGFDYCGISKAEFLEAEAPRLESWLTKNMHGEMKYMENYFDKRLDPRLLVDGARSVVSLLLNYYPSFDSNRDDNPTIVSSSAIDSQNDSIPNISKYAYGT